MAFSSEIESPEVVRFAPAEVDGASDVSEVAFFADRVEMMAGGQKSVFEFQNFAQWQQGALKRLWRRITGRNQYPKIAGEREYCTDRRYVTIYSTPRLKFYLPPDFDKGYAQTYICRIDMVMLKGGFATHDLS